MAVAPSSTPTTLPQTSGTLRTSTTRTRPRTAIGATHHPRPTTTTSGRRCPRPRRRWAGQRRQRPVRLRRSAGTLAPVRHQLRLRPPGLPHPVPRVGIRRLDAPADAARDERPVRRRLVHRRHDARQGLRQRRPASDGALPRSAAGSAAHHPHALPADGPLAPRRRGDYCEGDGSSGCFTCTMGTRPAQVWRRHAFDLSQWHTVRFEQRNHVVKAYIDDLRTPVWTYRGSSRTLPDTKKQVVLQQECRPSGCPAGTSGTEDIQIDWITVENPA